MSKSCPDRADVAPTEPTNLARSRPRATQSFFPVRAAILIKASAIFDELSHFASVNSAILTHILEMFCLVILLE
jgi:hypothetical protein